MIRVLHVNLAKRGIGRYGLLYGRALAGLENVRALSIFDTALLDIPFLRQELGELHVSPVDWSTQNKWRGLRELRQIVSEFEPDIIHDSGGCYARSLPVWLALRQYAPLVVTEHDPHPHLGRILSLPERATREMMPTLMRHIFVHGPRCKESLVRRGIHPERVSTIRHGHLGMFDRNVHPQTIRTNNEILFFGELRYNKGADLLPGIADRVLTKCPTARFIVAGSYTEPPGDSSISVCVRDALAEMKRRPEFEVHDRFIPDDEVEYLFKRAAITVMPYREATQSGIAMIAMPLESVVVATAVGDIPDVIRDGITGYLVDPAPEVISKQIVELLESPDQLRQVRKAAREYALQNCSWEGAARRVVAKCETIVPERERTSVSHTISLISRIWR